MFESLVNRISGVKKSRRPWLDLDKLNGPVEAARGRLEAAQTSHAALLEKFREHSAAETAATAAFEAHGDDATADKVIELNRTSAKQKLFKARSQRAVDRATSELREAEVTRDAAVLAKLDEIYDGARGHIQKEWQAIGLPAVKQIVGFLDEADQIIKEAAAAGTQASHTRGDGQASAKQMQLDALRGMTLQLLHAAAPEHFYRLARFVR